MSIESKTVLIVDDMKTVRLCLKQICKELGIGVIHEAVDGKDALEMLEGVQVDLVLSDWNMPNLTGMDLVTKMRANPKTIGVPVIFITSESEKSAILRSLLSGVTDYIVKPFSDVVVKQKVCQALKVQPKT